MTTQRKVPLAWESLEDAFENNAPQVHSYLQLESGEVLRLVDGTADPELLLRVTADPLYVPVAPVSSREQYRWMEHFILTVDEEPLTQELTAAIDGKGAFRRFKDVLMAYPVARERWFKFRSERLRDCMTSWLDAHGIEAAPRPEWRVPTADDVLPDVARRGERSRAQQGRAKRSVHERATLHELVDKLPVRALDSVLAFLEFTLQRKPLPLSDEPPASLTGDGSEDGTSQDDESEGDDSADLEASADA